MTAIAQNIEHIPLNKLTISDRNVRKLRPSKQQDQELMASIRSQGVLQNLIVIPSSKNGHYETIAGGRRLEMLKVLAKEKAIKSSHPVPCLIAPEDATPEDISLMENINRANMHPADEFEAYQALKAQGQTIKDIANRYGVSQRHVKQRLKLANVAPELINAYRAGETTLDIITAFTIEDDHQKQLDVWKSLKSNHWLSDHHIKSALKETAITSKHKLVKLVGAKAYRDAGGTITTDLFEDKQYFNEPHILQNLAIDLLTKQAEEIQQAEGWKWCGVLLEKEWDSFNQYTEITATPGELPNDLAAEKARIDKRFDELEEIVPDNWTEEHDNEEERLRDESEALDDKIDALAVYKPEEKALAGCIAYVDHNGGICIERGLVAKDDQKALRALQQPGTTNEDDSGDEDQPEPEASTLPKSLLQDLQNTRLAIAQQHLQNNHALAQDLLIYTLCLQNASNMHHLGGPLDINSRTTLQPQQLSTANLKLLWVTIDNTAERFAAFQSLTPKEKQSLMAHCVALSLKGQLANTPYNDQVIESAISQLHINWSEQWRPTANNYFSRIGKPDLIEHGKPLLGDEWANDASKAKKGVIAETLQIAHNGTGDERMSEDAINAAAQWVPAEISTNH